MKEDNKDNQQINNEVQDGISENNKPHQEDANKQNTVKKAIAGSKKGAKTENAFDVLLKIGFSKDESEKIMNIARIATNINDFTTKEDLGVFLKVVITNYLQSEAYQAKLAELTKF